MLNRLYGKSVLHVLLFMLGTLRLPAYGDGLNIRSRVKTWNVVAMQAPHAQLLCCALVLPWLAGGAAFAKSPSLASWACAMAAAVTAPVALIVAQRSR